MKTMKEEKPNRDPLTGEQKAHPIGTGIGATAGGVAGAAATGAVLGAVGGPAGAAIGAGVAAIVAGTAAGAVAGGILGKAAGEALNPTQFRDFIEKSVVDYEGHKIGTLASVLSDDAGEPAYLGVQTDWLGVGTVHIIPAYAVEFDTNKKQIRVPMDKEEIKNAPSFKAVQKVNAEIEQAVYSYWPKS